MTTNETREEIEQYLGQVPSWMDELAPQAQDHSWGMFRDLELAETELSEMEKELVGLGAAAAMGCPYCVEFHTRAAALAGASDAQVTEAITMASNTRYFSTVLHGAGVDVEEFAAETDEVMDYMAEQQASADDD